MAMPWHRTKVLHMIQYCEINADEIEPFVTWGTNPSMGSGITAHVPYADDFRIESDKEALKKALAYMGLEEGAPLTSIEIQHVFIGSCTNARLSDLRAAAKVIEGKKVHPSVTAIVVPGSRTVKKQAEEEGLDQVFIEAGFRMAGIRLQYVPCDE